MKPSPKTQEFLEKVFELPAFHVSEVLGKRRLVVCSVLNPVVHHVESIVGQVKTKRALIGGRAFAGYQTLLDGARNKIATGVGVEADLLRDFALGSARRSTYGHQKRQLTRCHMVAEQHRKNGFCLEMRTSQKMRQMIEQPKLM